MFVATSPLQIVCTWLRLSCQIAKDWRLPYPAEVSWNLATEPHRVWPCRLTGCGVAVTLNKERGYACKSNIPYMFLHCDAGKNRRTTSGIRNTVTMESTDLSGI